MPTSKLPDGVQAMLGGALVFGVAAVLVLSASVSSAGAPPAEEPIAVSAKTLQDFPQNARGQRFGSGLEARTPADEPDLIASIGTNGQEGYVLKSDMRGIQPKTPAEAIALSDAARKAGPREIPLYAADGITIIGSFRLG